MKQVPWHVAEVVAQLQSQTPPEQFEMGQPSGQSLIQPRVWSAQLASQAGLEPMQSLSQADRHWARAPRAGGEDDSLVLVLHGPEVEFFAIRNYEKYRDIVDQAARLDAFEVVDVRI